MADSDNSFSCVFDRDTIPSNTSRPFGTIDHRYPGLSDQLSSDHGFPQAGATIKHYELLRQLGQGAMGIIYLARDTRLDRLVAIKVLRPRSIASAERFFIEAQDTARCRHNHIVSIHDVDEYRGYPYMVLEYLEGQTLRAWMNRRACSAAVEPATEWGVLPSAVPVSLAVRLMLPVIRALSCVHERGIVHCDLKPENIFVTSQGRVVVLDFGIAQRLEARRPPAIELLEQPLPTNPGTGFTQKGTLFGTLPYMSPEQLRAEAIDARSDLWSAGIILYELITGRHPLASRSIFELFEIAGGDEPMPSFRDRRPDAGAIGAIIDRCLQKQRDQRYRSAGELLSVLYRRAACSARPMPPRRYPTPI